VVEDLKKKVEANWEKSGNYFLFFLRLDEFEIKTCQTE
jgi:hypothetical protein